jgi:hypothetical protein
MSFAAARSSSGAGRGGRGSIRTANLLTRAADQKLIDSWDATRLGETYDEQKWRLDDPPDNVSDAWMRLHAGGLAPSVNFASPGRNAAGGRHGDSLLTPAARAVGYTHSAPIGTGHRHYTKNEKGSRKPIQSKNFRDRYQIDLIDMSKLRKRDPFGVLMRWIMTVKDHATGLTSVYATYGLASVQEYTKVIDKNEHTDDKNGNCKNTCGCKKNNVKCHSGCRCNGN